MVFGNPEYQYQYAANNPEVNNEHSLKPHCSLIEQVLYKNQRNTVHDVQGAVLEIKDVSLHEQACTQFVHFSRMFHF